MGTEHDENAPRAAGEDPVQPAEPGRASPRRLGRLGVWAVLVVVAAGAPALARVGPIAGFADGGRWLAVFVSGLALTGFLGLLVTTPAGATKLPWSVSAGLIAVGSAAGPWLVAGGAIGLSASATAAVTALLLFAVLFTPSAPVSPWYAALALWQPGAWAMFLGVGVASASPIVVLVGSVAVLSGLGVSFGRMNGWSARRTLMLWSGSLAASIAAMALVP
mgnify:CR=1 FL=1